jgi:hypothetical protein
LSSLTNEQVITGVIGRVYVTEVVDDPHPSSNPIQDWETGREVHAVVLGVWQDSKRGSQNGVKCYELSTRPSYLAAAKAEAPGFDFARQPVSPSSLSKKVTYQG